VQHCPPIFCHQLLQWQKNCDSVGVASYLAILFVGVSANTSASEADAAHLNFDDRSSADQGGAA